jgi:precorrin-6Y C5,15-methyltransferase (decarboxylating)
MSKDPWLSIIGIGEDGLAGLPPAAQQAIGHAELLVGGARHLALAGPARCETLAWPSPLQDAFPMILARRGRPTVILATGDPFFHGVGSLIAAHIDASEFAVFPAPSAYMLAAAKLGWPGQDCLRISLHGRALERIIRHLQPGAKILALSWDESTPRKLAALLTRSGFGASRLVVLEALGGPRETIRATSAEAFAIDNIDPLNMIALEVIAEPAARTIPFTPGLPDEWFEHDGQITKRDIRAVTLSALRPLQGQMLWDVGAGSGSVGIEWMLSHPSCRTIAIEARSDRAERLRRNALALGVPDLTIIEGTAPAAFAGLAPPDAAFIGGGATDPGLLDAVIAALKSGGRLVVNAVTLETQALLIEQHARHGGDLIQLSIARVDTVGAFHALKPAMAVLQWAWSKPDAGLESSAGPLLAIGVGCKSGVSADSVMALIETACAQIEGKATALYTAEEKHAEPALAEAALRLDLPLHYLTRAALKQAAPRAMTKSPRVLALFGVPSIAETAALAGAGPNSRLMLPRIAANGVTCAIATCAIAVSKVKA